MLLSYLVQARSESAELYFFVCVGAVVHSVCQVWRDPMSSAVAVCITTPTVDAPSLKGGPYWDLVWSSPFFRMHLTKVVGKLREDAPKVECSKQLQWMADHSWGGLAIRHLNESSVLTSCALKAKLSYNAKNIFFLWKKVRKTRFPTNHYVAQIWNLRGRSLNLSSLVHHVIVNTFHAVSARESFKGHYVWCKVLQETSSGESV